MIHHPIPGHGRQVITQSSQCLAILGEKGVEEPASARIVDGSEYLIHDQRL